LPDRDYALLAPRLHHVEAASHQTLYDPSGDKIGEAYFPCRRSLLSYVVRAADGREVDAILIGSEGAVGQINGPAYSRIVVKLRGPIVRASPADLEAAKRKSPALRDVLARQSDYLLAQALQTTACNAVHSIEQRTAKRILKIVKRIGEPVVPFTHEQLAAIVGARRSYISRVIETLKKEGVVATSRGAILVRDPAGLQARSCRCDQLLDAYFEVRPRRTLTKRRRRSGSGFRA
jgi:hypothetical protein